MSDAPSAPETPAEASQDGGRPGHGGHRHSSNFLRWAHSKHDAKFHHENADPERQPLLDEEAEAQVEAEESEAPQAPSLTKKEKVKLFFTIAGAKLKSYAKYVGAGLAAIFIIVAIGFVAGYFLKKGKQNASACTLAACVHIASDILAVLPPEPKEISACSDFYGLLCHDFYVLPPDTGIASPIAPGLNNEPTSDRLQNTPLPVVEHQIHAVFRHDFDQGIDQVEQAAKITDNIKEALVHDIEEAEWFTAETRIQATAKLRSSLLQHGHLPVPDGADGSLSTTLAMKPLILGKNAPQYLNYASYGLAATHELLTALVSPHEVLNTTSSIVPTIDTQPPHNACSAQIEYYVGAVALRAAYDAWQRAKKGSDPVLPGLEHLSNEQMFFIALGRAQCRLEGAKERMKTVVQTSVDFAEAFGCEVSREREPLCHAV